MEYTVLQEKRDYLRRYGHTLPRAVLDNYETAFAIEYAHHSTAIEGNTLSLLEMKLLLEDRLSVGGKWLREIYEVVNHDRAFRYCVRRAAGGKPLDEETVRGIHKTLMDNILPGGVYRNVNVRITGACHQPPEPGLMREQLGVFYRELAAPAERDPMEQAAWTHAEFVRIHPFPDGNGRTSRLLMNYRLMLDGFLPVSIPYENRRTYYAALDTYAGSGSLAAFVEIIAPLELARLDWYNAAITATMAQKPEGGMDMRL